jgi:hypothetical protein
MRYGKRVLRTWLQHAFLVAFGACGACLGAWGCKGSEHVVLAPILQTPDNPSAGSTGGGAGGSSPPDGGNSQPVDAGGPDADASPPVIDSGLDPNVVFEWVETPPGTGSCGENQYAGAWSCTVEGRPPFVGQIILSVAPSGEGESSLLVTGWLADPTGLFFGADVMGSLDCAANTLEAVTLEMEPSLFGFDATIRGDYDPQTLEIVGELEIINDAQEVCIGSFQVGATL